MTDIKSFELFLAEQQESKFYINFILKDGYIIFEDGNEFSWKYFKNFTKKGLYTINAKPGVMFQFIQGTPVISVPTNSFENSGNVIVEETGRFYSSKEFKILKKAIDLKSKHKMVVNLPK